MKYRRSTDDVRVMSIFIGRSSPSWAECDRLTSYARIIRNIIVGEWRKQVFSDGIQYCYEIIDDEGNTKTIWYHSLSELDKMCRSAGLYDAVNHPDIGIYINTKYIKQIAKNVSSDITGYFGKLNKAKAKNIKRPSAPKPHYGNDKRSIYIVPNECILKDRGKGYPISGTSLFLRVGRIPREDIKSVSIVPALGGYNMVITYDRKKIAQPTAPNNSKYLSIDLGMVILMALTSNDWNVPHYVINGRHVLHIIRKYNRLIKKEKKRLQHRKSTTSKRLQTYERRLRNIIKDIFHKLSKMVIQHCIDNDIRNIVIGENIGWKHCTRLGRQTTKLFQRMPYTMLKYLISYKAKDRNIFVTFNNEAHTSKCSFYDREPIQHHSKYVGKRTKRGLFITANGHKVHADINGSLNILRKHKGDGIYDWTVVAPKNVRLIDYNVNDTPSLQRAITRMAQRGVVSHDA